jgi:type IV pilus assembly protein PilN
MAGGLQKLDFELIEINMLPTEYRQKKADLSWLSDMRVVWSTFAVICVALILLLLHHHTVETANELKREIAQTKEEVEKERPFLEEINKLERELKGIEQKKNALRSIQVSRKRWVVLFDNLSTALPPNTWVTSITQNEGLLNISCSTWSFSEIALYMLKLEQKESITRVELTNINASKINGEDGYNFTLNVSFDINLGLETGVR